jgi:hypothetical protein
MAAGKQCERIHMIATIVFQLFQCFSKQGGVNLVFEFFLLIFFFTWLSMLMEKVYFLSTVYGVAMGLRHAVPSKPYTKKV